MAVTPEYREFVLEQLGRVAPVASRAMFGGVGIYADGMIFGLMDDDTTYLKVDDGNRGAFEAAGMGPFSPYGDGQHVMQYYELPADLLDDADALRPWVAGALDAARAARRKKKR
ncbi:MAG TPA: TfoX/Sxy family protein [Longimicrobium sp.]|jgi:DNA transformation protein|nr:TfoX/Sxy family protein [Longimicrobium sp.]